jgi:hypothetical protein
MAVQEATQSMFFKAPSQATLHPFLAYVNIDDKIVPYSMCVFSDSFNHDSTSVNSFLIPVISYVKSIVPQVDVIKYFTDGAASQYKNYKNFANLLHHGEDFGMRAEWNFFATSHGKGPCDGIGGTIKRLAYRNSLQGGNIQTPLALFQWASENIENIKMFFVNSESIVANQKRLEARYCEGRTLPGTQSFHKFVPKSMFEMNAYDISENPNFKTFNNFPSPVFDSPVFDNVFDYFTLAVGMYVACLYVEDGLWYLSEIIAKNDELLECQMQFFSLPGTDSNIQGFKSSKKRKDQTWVSSNDILKIVKTLEKTSTRGRSFKIANSEHDIICDLYNKKMQDS